MTSEPLIFDLSVPGRTGVRPPLPQFDPVDAATALPESELRRDLDLPEVSEVDVMRHFVRLSQRNHSVDTAMYPLGSCTMKYNPKINEAVARLPGFTAVHPYQPATVRPGGARADSRAGGPAWRDHGVSRSQHAARGRVAG